MNATVRVAAGLLLSMHVLANTQYEAAADFADSVKGEGMAILEGTEPSAIIPGYTASPVQRPAMAA